MKLFIHQEVVAIENTHKRKTHIKIHTYKEKQI